MVEIDKEHFCSRWSFPSDIRNCLLKGDGHCAVGDCRCYHRKWPTKKQFEEEYGFKPDNHQFWYLYAGGYSPYEIEECDHVESVLGEWTDAPFQSDGHVFVDYEVVACTPYGKPPKGWRPEQ